MSSSGPAAARRRAHRPGTIERAVISATRDAAGWLRPADEAVIWAARAVAEEIDRLRRPPAAAVLFEAGEDPETARLIGELTGRLVRLSDSLGLTPAARARMGVAEPGPDLAAELVALVTAGPAADATG
jgi:hypothetical protein